MLPFIELNGEEVRMMVMMKVMIMTMIMTDVDYFDCFNDDADHDYSNEGNDDGDGKYRECWE